MSRVTRINGPKWICWYSPILHPKSLHLVGFSCSGTWRGKHQHGSPHRAGEKQCISSIAEEKEKHGRRGELREVLHTRITWPMSKCPGRCLATKLLSACLTTTRLIQVLDCFPDQIRASHLCPLDHHHYWTCALVHHEPRTIWHTQFYWTLMYTTNSTF